MAKSILLLHHFKDLVILENVGQMYSISEAIQTAWHNTD